MDLTTLTQGVHKRKLKKRVGRGIGSGHGKTASRGHKGQYSSAGANMPGQLFIGGTTPLHRRVPKRGFSNATWAKNFAIVNIGDLEVFDAGATVNMETLKEKRLIVGTFDGVRVLGNGEATKKLTVVADHFTKRAKEQLEAKGGTCELIPPPKKPVRTKMGKGKRDVRRAEAAKQSK